MNGENEWELYFWGKQWHHKVTWLLSSITLEHSGKMHQSSMLLKNPIKQLVTDKRMEATTKKKKIWYRYTDQYSYYIYIYIYIYFVMIQMSNTWQRYDLRICNVGRIFYSLSINYVTDKRMEATTKKKNPYSYIIYTLYYIYIYIFCNDPSNVKHLTKIWLANM